MLHQTRGIVIRTTKYSETSVVTKIYTEALGMQSYIVNGVRGPKSRSKGSLLQPLSLLDMVVYYREHKNLQRIKEYAPAYLYNSLPVNIKKGAIALFMAEVINKTIIDETENGELFTFLFDSFVTLDKVDGPVANFHVYFMVIMSRLLGFAPQIILPESTGYFDMLEGSFHKDRPAHPNVMEPGITDKFAKLLVATDYDVALKISMNATERKILLGDLLHFYELHQDHFRNIHSHIVLDTVFRS